MAAPLSNNIHFHKYQLRAQTIKSDRKTCSSKLSPLHSSFSLSFSLSSNSSYWSYLWGATYAMAWIFIKLDNLRATSCLSLNWNKNVEASLSEFSELYFWCWSMTDGGTLWACQYNWCHVKVQWVGFMDHSLPHSLPNSISLHPPTFCLNATKNLTSPKFRQLYSIRGLLRKLLLNCFH